MYRHETKDRSVEDLVGNMGTDANKSKVPMDYGECPARLCGQTVKYPDEAN